MARIFRRYCNDVPQEKNWTRKRDDVVSKRAPLIAPYWPALYPLSTDRYLFLMWDFLLAIGALCCHIPQPPRTLEGQRRKGIC